MTSLMSKSCLSVLAFASLCACSSPNPVLYTISPINGREQSGAPPVIDIEQIGLARYLERSEVVRSSEGYRLTVMANDWWGEPLGPMLSRIVATELQQRLPGSTVVSDTGAVSVPTDTSIALNVERLDENASGLVVLQVQAALYHEGRSRALIRTFRFSAAPPTPGTEGEVAAISSAVAQLADALAVMIVENTPNHRCCVRHQTASSSGVR
jgi:uncharacterized protein